MFLSVVVCTYNRKEYLLQCLKNIMESSIDSSKFEVLVVDNNSTDDTDSLVGEFVQKFKNVFYFKETNQGLSYARNRAMREAGGDFILYLDDDALINPHGIEHLFDFLTQNPDAAVVGGKCVIKYLDKKPDWLTKKGEDWIGAYDFGDNTIEVNRSNMKKRIVRLPIGACFCVKKGFPLFNRRI
jgi:glycosyltransferase involved in cell wall biosynthesis